MFAVSEDQGRFPVLDVDQMDWIVRLGEVRQIEDGQEILTENEDGYDFFAVREGRIQISKRTSGGATILRTHGKDEFIGELGLLSGGPSPVTARAMGPATVVRLSRSALRDVLANCPEMAELVIPALARRVHDVEGLLQERERLVSLGKLAAGLAHELNNPVAAGRRAVDGVRDRLTNLRDHALALGESCFASAEIAEVRQELAKAADYLSLDANLDPLERSDREERVGEWLDERGDPRAWENAGILVASGFDVTCLSRLVGRYDDDAARRILDFLSTQLSVEVMLRDADRSLSRITDIVRAVKNYSRMDESPLVETDLNAGIEDTLKMLAYPLRPFRLVRDFAMGLPTVCAYASELNQVWTNLIDNAIGAMGKEGVLTIRTRLRNEIEVQVDIEDTGPGIPDDVRPHIFEAFFTTKPVGEGTGLGLDIVHRIVTVRHNGRLELETSPAGTTFRVILPIQQPKM